MQKKDIDVTNLELLSVDELNMLTYCPDKDLKYYEKVETLPTFVSWLLLKLILCIPTVIGVTLNYLMIGRFRLPPWKELDDKVNNTEI